MMKTKANRWKQRAGAGLFSVTLGLSAAAALSQDKTDHPGVTPGEMAYKSA